MILKLYGKEGKQVMVKFNGLPVSYNDGYIARKPIFNEVEVFVYSINDGKYVYEIAYQCDYFRKYRYKAESFMDAVEYIFNVHNLYPFHTFRYNRFKSEVSDKMQKFLRYLSLHFSPLQVSVTGSRGIKESFNIWLCGNYIQYSTRNSTDTIICKEYISLKEVKKVLEEKISTYNGPVLFDVPWYARNSKYKLDEYSIIIPVMSHKICGAGGSYTGTVIWTDGIASFHEKIFGKNAEVYNKMEKDIMTSIKSIYKGRRVHKYTRCLDLENWNDDDKTMDFLKDYASSWTGYMFDINKPYGQYIESK